MSLIPSANPSFRRKLAYGSASFVVLFLIGLGVMAKNGWLMSEPGAVATGVSAGPNAVPPMPTPEQVTHESLREYVHSGSRLLAIEDAAHGWEADLAPRPWGDGLLRSNDIQIIRDIFDGSITPDAATNEYQRADAAPEGTLGGGGLDATDVQQVKNYVAVLDPMLRAGGPTSAPPPPPPAPPPGGENRPGMVAESTVPVVPGLERGIRVGTAAGRRGQTVTVPVLMNLRLGEVAASFTLEYDAARFSNPRVSLGPNLHPTTILTVNTRQPGKIGLLIDANASFVSLPVELPFILVTFDVRSTAAVGSTAISLTSSLVKQAVADRGANLLTTRYTNGSVSVTQ